MTTQARSSSPTLPGVLSAFLLWVLPLGAAVGCGGGVDAADLKRDLAERWTQVREATLDGAERFRDVLKDEVAELEHQLEDVKRRLAENEDLQLELDEAKEALARLAEKIGTEGAAAWNGGAHDTEESWNEVRDELVRAYEEVQELVAELVKELG